MADSEFNQKWESQLKKGVLISLVLVLLRKKEMYGYEIMQTLQEHFNLEVAEGTIYPMMNRIKKDNLVTSYWHEKENETRRRYFKLTEEGYKRQEEMRLFINHLIRSYNRLVDEIDQHPEMK